MSAFFTHIQHLNHLNAHKRHTKNNNRDITKHHKDIKTTRRPACVLARAWMCVKKHEAADTWRNLNPRIYKKEKWINLPNNEPRRDCFPPWFRQTVAKRKPPSVHSRAGDNKKNVVLKLVQTEKAIKRGCLLVNPKGHVRLPIEQTP